MADLKDLVFVKKLSDRGDTNSKEMCIRDRY